MKKLRVSVIQMQVALEDKKANLERAKALMSRACLDDPDLLLLPETFNVGFFPADPRPCADEGVRGESWQLLSETARKHGVNIVGGSIVRMGPLNEVFNTMYVFNREGAQVAQYDKIHLFSPSGEKNVFTAGGKPCFFELEEVLMAGIICYDLRFVELIRGLALDGAKVLFIPAEWPHPRSEHWRTLLRARAIENQMYVIAANACGPMGKVENCGYSAIIDPWGKVVAEAGEEEIIITTDLDFTKVDNVRNQIAVYRDRQPESYSLALLQ